MYLFFDIEVAEGDARPKRNQPLTKLTYWPRITKLSYCLYAHEKRLLQAKTFSIAHPESAQPGRVSPHQMEMAEALQQFEKVIFLATHLVSHNTRWKRNVLGAEFIRHHLPDPMRPIPKFCLRKNTPIARFCAIPSTPPCYFHWPSLEELSAKLFGTSLPQNSIEDRVEAMSKCFFALLNKKVI